MMKIKPIRTEAEYHEALAEIEKLWGAKQNTPKGDRLDVFITLVDAYEREHHDIAPPDPIDAIQFRMEQEGLKRKDLEPYIGRSGRVSEVLNGKRHLTLEMIRSLHKELKIPLESLVGIDVDNRKHAHKAA